MPIQKDSGQRATADTIIVDDPHKTSETQFPRESSDRMVYQPLDFTGNSIRVIDFLPGPGQSVLRCTMRNTTITEATYTCLSYTWDPSNPEHMIEVNGCSIPVGNNLYQFLLAFRSSVASRSLDEPSKFDESLWIDAISINQHDALEKNHQVRQMGAIYNAAVEVIIWPGILNEGLVQLFEDLANTEDLCSKSPSWPHKSHDIISAQVKQQIGVMEASRKAELQERVNLFLKLPYWNRVWIAQEILSRSSENSLIIFSGRRFFDMFYLRDQLLTMTDTFDWNWRKAEKEKRPGLHEAVPMCVKYLLWLDPHNHHPGDTRASLPSLLTYFYRGGCRDKRDRVFALLSLAHQQPHIEVDYEIEPTKLFQTILESFMDAEPLDKIMRFGASLIQALEIRRTSCKQNCIVSQPTVKEHGKVQDLRLLIKRPHSGVVARPVWAEAEVEVPQNKEHTYPCAGSNVSRSMMCVYVGIFDAENFHVFEYAVEESEDGVTVHYARAYDYLRGKPQPCEIPETSCKCGESRLMWLNMPSEKVHYLRGPFDGFQWARNPPLVAWRSPEFYIVEDNGANRGKNESSPFGKASHRLVSAIRSWKDDILWSGGFQYHWHTKIFLSAHEEIEATIQSLPPLFSQGEKQPMPLHPRATRMVIFSAETMASRPAGPWIEPTKTSHPGL